MLWLKKVREFLHRDKADQAMKVHLQVLQEDFLLRLVHLHHPSELILANLVEVQMIL